MDEDIDLTADTASVGNVATEAALPQSYTTLAVAQGFLAARGLNFALTEDDILSAARMMPAPPAALGYIPEQMANAQAWLAYYVVSQNQLGLINANINLKLIGCDPAVEYKYGS